MSKITNLLSNLNWEQVRRVFLMALFFSLPLWPKLTTILIISNILLSLTTFNRAYFNRLFGHTEFLIFILLYFLLLMGLFYSVDLPNGLSKVQTQLSLLVFPVILGGVKWSRANRHVYFISFLSGLLFTVILCIGNAIFRVWKTGSSYVVDSFSRQNSVFLYNEFSAIIDLHPTYFALYLGIAIFYLVLSYFRRFGDFYISRPLLITVFFTTLFLTLSKAGIFSLVLLLLLYFVFLGIRTGRRTFFLSFIATLFGTVMMLLINPALGRRSLQAWSGLGTVYLENQYTNESTSTRFNLWNLSTKVAAESLFLGYGTGSVQKVLNTKCLTFNSFSTCEGLRDKNSHNQYLNFLLSNGIIFLSLFIIALSIMLFKAIKNKDFLTIFFTAFLGMNFLFESLLQRERGIIFFTLFAVFLSISGKEEIQQQ